jgi:uncharacterized protein with NRDE domain
MCVVAVAIEAHPRWRFIMAGNRDELHARPALPLARWPDDDSHILAGRDVQLGGTWLGVSEQGRVAVVTNIRTGMLPDPAKLSRGDLVADYLRGDGVPALASLGGYNPFSLLSYGPEGAMMHANRPAGLSRALPPGVHGLSNGLPDEIWPRKSELLRQFTAIIGQHDDPEAPLLTMLRDETSTAPLFIRDATYGTRCSTVMLIDYAGKASIIERSFDAVGIIARDARLSFRFA